jgi:CNT family concentrative nucleoside transporter
MSNLTGLLGVTVFVAIALLFSTARSRINWRLVASGIALQFTLAFLLLRFPPVVALFEFLARAVTKIISFSDAGITFVFGELGNAGGPWGFVFAVRVLPVIIFFASIMAILYHLRVMQAVVACVAWVLRRTLGVTGAEATSAAANIFVGQTEAPLTIRPYLPTMTRSQICAVMVGGFATIAGSVLAAFVGILGGESEEARVLFAKHLLTASVMSAPAGLVMAKLLMPETETPRDEALGSLLAQPVETRNVLDAAVSGASDGLRLALNVGAMLIAFAAIIAMLNWPLSALSEQQHVASWRADYGIPILTLQTILGTLFTPAAWLMGVPWADCTKFGSLIGQQVVATEFVAYLNLSDHIANGTVSPRTSQIAAYALCGFANLPSIAIQIGGLSALAPAMTFSGCRQYLSNLLTCSTKFNMYEQQQLAPLGNIYSQ